MECKKALNIVVLKRNLIVKLCLFIIILTLCTGKDLVDELPGLLIAGDVKEHHHSPQNTIEDGEASIQSWILHIDICSKEITRLRSLVSSSSCLSM